MDFKAYYILPNNLIQEKASKKMDYASAAGKAIGKESIVPVLTNNSSSFSGQINSSLSSSSSSDQHNLRLRYGASPTFYSMLKGSSNSFLQDQVEEDETPAYETYDLEIGFPYDDESFRFVERIRGQRHPPASLLSIIGNRRLYGHFTVHNGMNNIDLDPINNNFNNYNTNDDLEYGQNYRIYNHNYIEMEAFSNQLYSKELVHIVQNQCVFYIVPKPQFRISTHLEKDQLEAVILHYARNKQVKSYIGEIIQDDYLKSTNAAYIRRFNVLFTPEQPGMYTLSVILKNREVTSTNKQRSSNNNNNQRRTHICGSPMVFNVTRNYTEDAKKFVELKMVLESTRQLAGTPAFYEPIPQLFMLTPANETLIFSPATVPKKPKMMPVIQNSPQNCKPWGITYCSKTDEIFATARETHEIFKFSAKTGEYISSFGIFGTKTGQVNRPTGICYDRCADRIVIADKDNHRISFFNIHGIYLSQFGSKGFLDGELNYPWGLDVSKDGTFIAVADSRNHRVQLFNIFGLFLYKYSVFENNPFEYKYQFNYPRGICFSQNSDAIYVTDFNLNTVIVLDINLTTQQELLPKGILLRPQGISLDSFGNIVICDAKNDCIRIVGQDRTLIATIYGFGKQEKPPALDIQSSPEKLGYYFGKDGCLYSCNAAPVNYQDHQGSSSSSLPAAAEDSYSPTFDSLCQPLNACCLHDGKLAILDASGIIRIF